MRQILMLLFMVRFDQVVANWHEWWTYDGISGPSYWGVINPAWNMCSRGRHQSPIDISPDRLVYDGGLDDHPFVLEKKTVSGTLLNTGQALVFKLDLNRMGGATINMSGGPLSYRYQFEQMILHWGNLGEGASEHSVNGIHYPLEVQLYGYNAQLFTNLSEAVLHPHGVVGVAIMVQESDRAVNMPLMQIISHAGKVKYRGQSYPVHGLNLQELLPSTTNYMTYEGSVTYPGCWETIHWIIMNKPIYSSADELSGLRMLMQGEESNPKAPLSKNSRPIQPINNRVVRTNIAFSPQTDDKECLENIKDISFKSTLGKK